jgi:hypothetical protein
VHEKYSIADPQVLHGATGDGHSRNPAWTLMRIDEAKSCDHGHLIAEKIKCYNI